MGGEGRQPSYKRFPSIGVVSHIFFNSPWQRNYISDPKKFFFSSFYVTQLCLLEVSLLAVCFILLCNVFFDRSFRYAGINSQIHSVSLASHVRFISSFTCQLISVIITTLIIYHSFTLSLQAQNLPFQQILPTLILLLLTILPLRRTYHAS